MENNLSPIFVNLSKPEQNVLMKGFNFCPTSKDPNRIKLLDDLHFFCRKLQKEYFHSPEDQKKKLSSIMMLKDVFLEHGTFYL